MTTLTLFQWCAISLLFAIFVFELWQAARGERRRGFWTLRVVIWITAGLAIYRPELLTQLAKMLGIQRGADLVLYMAVLFFVAIWIFLYSCYLRQQEQITLIVRRLAIQTAQEPDTATPIPGDAESTR